jgi:hypothetical protein
MPRRLINKTLRRRGTADFKSYAKLRTTIFERCFLHEQKPKIIEVAGKAIMVDPSQWSERRTSTVSMHPGYREKDDMPQKLKGLYKGLVHHRAALISSATRHGSRRDAIG